MRFTIRGKNIEVTEGLRSAVTEKLGKLEKYFTPETEIIVTLSVEKDRQKIEVTIPVKGNIIRSEQVSNDMYVSIDLVEEVIERQLRKYKTKIIGKHKDGGNLRKEFIEKENEGEEEEVKIRLRRMGQKKAPFYRIVVADSRSPRDGRFIEEIGTYDPNQEPSVFKVDEEAAKKWLNNGAQPTEVVGKIFKAAGIEK